MSEHLGDCINPKSTTWSCSFVCGNFDDYRWIENFRMSQLIFFQFVEKLRHKIKKHNTHWKLVDPIEISIACSIYKLAHVEVIC